MSSWYHAYFPITLPNICISWAFSHTGSIVHAHHIFSLTSFSEFTTELAWLFMLLLVWLLCPWMALRRWFPWLPSRRAWHDVGGMHGPWSEEVTNLWSTITTICGHFGHTLWSQILSTKCDQADHKVWSTWSQFVTTKSSTMTNKSRSWIFQGNVSNTDTRVLMHAPRLGRMLK